MIDTEREMLLSISMFFLINPVARKPWWKVTPDYVRFHYPLPRIKKTRMIFNLFNTCLIRKSSPKDYKVAVLIKVKLAIKVDSQGWLFLLLTQVMMMKTQNHCIYSWLSIFLGAIAVVLAIFAVFITSHEMLLILVSACLALCAYRSGIVFGILAITINLLNLLFLSSPCAMAAAPCSGTAYISSDQMLEISIYTQLIALTFLYLAYIGSRR